MLFKIKQFYFFYPYKKLIIFLVVLFFLIEHKAFSSMLEDDIYNDPEILKIFIQKPILEAIDSKLKKGLQRFKQAPAEEQANILSDFHILQDQLEEEYQTSKTKLTHKRLGKYGMSTLATLIAPFVLLMSVNLILPESYQLNMATVPYIIFHGSSFFMFKFLELFSRKYIASFEGSIRAYEIEYIRNKPLYEKDFCETFEDRLIAAHKNSSNIHEHLKWFKAALHLPISKKALHIDQLMENLSDKFEKFLPSICKKVKKICLRHLIQEDTRVIAYFHGPSGTGKSKCARKIARYLGLPFGSIALANYTVADLIGQGGSHLPYPGKFAEAILNAKDDANNSYTNMVLRIEEADKVLNAEDDYNGLLPFFLTFLDPDVESFYSPYFERDIRIKDSLIILCGEHPLKNNATRKRVINVEFKPHDKEYKKKYIVEKYIPELYKKTKKSHRLRMKDHFTKEDQEKIFQFIDMDEDPGLRNVKEKARKFVDKKIDKVFFSNNYVFSEIN